MNIDINTDRCFKCKISFIDKVYNNDFYLLRGNYYCISCINPIKKNDNNNLKRKFNNIIKRTQSKDILIQKKKIKKSNDSENEKLNFLKPTLNRTEKKINFSNIMTE